MADEPEATGIPASTPEAPKETLEVTPPITEQIPGSEAPTGEAEEKAVAEAPKVEEPDWKAEAARLKAENEAIAKRAADAEEARKRAENNIKSEQGNTKKAQADAAARDLEHQRETAYRDAYEAAKEDAIEAGSTVKEAREIARKQADEATAPIRQKIVEHNESGVREQFQTTGQAMRATFTAAGLVWTDREVSPELAKAKSLYTKAVQYGDVDLLAEAVEAVNEAVAAKKPAPVAVVAPVIQKRPAVERDGDLDTDTGRGSTVGIRATLANIDKLYLDWEDKYPDRPNPYAPAYRRVVETGRL